MASKTQELIDNIMTDYVTNPEDHLNDYNVDEMFPDYEYGCIDIIN